MDSRVIMFIGYPSTLVLIIPQMHPAFLHVSNPYGTQAPPPSYSTHFPGTEQPLNFGLDVRNCKSRLSTCLLTLLQRYLCSLIFPQLPCPPICSLFPISSSKIPMKVILWKPCLMKWIWRPSFQASRSGLRNASAYSNCAYAD